MSDRRRVGICRDCPERGTVDLYKKGRCWLCYHSAEAEAAVKRVTINSIFADRIAGIRTPEDAMARQRHRDLASRVNSGKIRQQDVYKPVTYHGGRR